MPWVRGDVNWQSSRCETRLRHSGQGPVFPVFRCLVSVLICTCFGSYMCFFQEKETKKNEPKEKYQRKHDLDKEEKGRREPKGLKSECELWPLSLPPLYKGFSSLVAVSSLTCSVTELGNSSLGSLEPYAPSVEPISVGYYVTVCVVSSSHFSLLFAFSLFEYDDGIR